MLERNRLLRRLLWAGLGSLLILGAACQRQSVTQTTPEYVSEVEALRQAKNKIFREGANSPLPPAAKPGFSGLIYYPVDGKYRIEVSAQPYSKQEVVEMVTSQGNVQSYLRYAYVDFAVDGRSARLTIYALRKGEETHYFLPFKDATNGAETYPAGRYMEVEIDKRWRTVLDFNKAYNPYCAYNHDYSCPMPPQENHLHIPIRAGERYNEPKS